MKSENTKIFKSKPQTSKSSTEYFSQASLGVVKKIQSLSQTLGKPSCQPLLLFMPPSFSSFFSFKLHVVFLFIFLPITRYIYFWEFSYFIFSVPLFLDMWIACRILIVLRHPQPPIFQIKLRWEYLLGGTFFILHSWVLWVSKLSFSLNLRSFKFIYL